MKIKWDTISKTLLIVSGKEYALNNSTYYSEFISKEIETH